jgi:ketosteroid isomerase-like protein
VRATLRERATTGVYLAALSSPEFTDLGATLDDDAHFAFAGFKDVHGRDSAVRAHELLFGDFESRSVTASRILLTDGSQAIEWTLTGIERGTEKPVAFRGITLLWTKDDGAIEDVHLYFDQAVVSAELGRGPKSLATFPPPPLPAGPPVALEQQGSADEREDVAVVRSSLDALEGSDESAYAGKMADDFELVTLEHAQPERGKAAARAYFKAMHRAVAHLDTGIDDIWGIGPYVVVEYHVVGEQIGPLGLIPAQKNNLLKLFVVDVVELRAGKIARIVRYDNPSQILVVSP